MRGPILDQERFHLASAMNKDAAEFDIRHGIQQVAAGSDTGGSEGQKTWPVPPTKQDTQLRISQEREKIEVSMDGAEADLALIE